MNNIGWRFDNSYARLSETMFSKLEPIVVKQPEIIILNTELSKQLGLNFSKVNKKMLALLFSGNLLPEGSSPIAQAYAGHQFGYFTMLGDGRAIILGEHLSPENNRYDIQFKGSGKTPYARGGDGRAAVGPMLREHIISEAMHNLNILTTRSLAVVKTGEIVFRETPLDGAILTRIASSHIRIGTFQFVSMKQDVEFLKSFIDYSIDRHYPEIKHSNNKSIDFLKTVMINQIELIVNWMRVGFIHGVMNTDNMTISGETIDYGPCAFMDSYDPQTVFSSIDSHGRYAFANQPLVAKWNLSRFAETLLPLINSNHEKAIKIAQETIDTFDDIYKIKWSNMMRNKLGLVQELQEDESLINQLLQWMHKNKADYTNTFSSLSKKNIKNEKLFQDIDFIEWHNKWTMRLKKNKISEEISTNLMKKNNPVVIPRNHIVEDALKEASENGNYTKINKLLNILNTPYEDFSDPDFNYYKKAPLVKDATYKTFCGT